MTKARSQEFFFTAAALPINYSNGVGTAVPTEALESRACERESAC
ncbi:hypothetical protein [Oscillatoria sp. FACHB-1406]|nr:hypothetical protein [Oscillatoria sp. FACHB-1406]